MDIEQAKRSLDSGGLVAIPTETVYGLAANATDTDAVARIFSVKNRPFFDPIILHVPSLEMMGTYSQSGLPLLAMQLAERFMPGPLTLVLPKADSVPDIVTSGMKSVAMRIPNHPMTLDLLRSLDYPLAAPSANPFGYVSPTSAAHVRQQLGGAIDGIIDGGPCAVGLESTIVSFLEAQPLVLRLGGTPLEVIEDCLHMKLKRQTSSSQPKAPGQLSSHYSPGRVVIPHPHGCDWEAIDWNLATDDAISWLPQSNASRSFTQGGDDREGAQSLFHLLRSVDNGKPGPVHVELAPDKGLGKAINDRLKRSAHQA